MSRYTERLWRELVQDHGAQLAGISRSARHGRMARPRLLAGTTVGLAGVGTAVALLLGAASSSPAFAVTRGHDGTVRVVIWRIDALHSVNARLAQLGLRARFVQVAPGCAVPAPAAVAHLFARREQVHVGSVSVVRGLVHARFDPRQIPAGKTLVMTAWRQGHEVKAGSGHVVLGAVPTCLPTAQVFGAATQARAGKGAGVQCFATGPVRPADSAPSTTTAGGVPSTTTTATGVPTTTTATGVPTTTTSAGPPYTVIDGPLPGATPACPPPARLLKALELARRAAAEHKH